MYQPCSMHLCSVLRACVFSAKLTFLGFSVVFLRHGIARPANAFVCLNDNFYCLVAVVATQRIPSASSYHKMFAKVVRSAAGQISATALRRAARPLTILDVKGVKEEIIERSDYPIPKCLEIMSGETTAVLGYGPQGRGQALNLRDNGFKVCVGVKKGKSWDAAVKDGWVEGKDLFSVEEASDKATVIQFLISDAGQKDVWPKIQPYLTPGKALYFSHGFGVIYHDQTGIIPPKDIDVILVAPKGSGLTVRTHFLEGRGINGSYAVFQDATGAQHV